MSSGNKFTKDKKSSYNIFINSWPLYTQDISVLISYMILFVFSSVQSEKQIKDLEQQKELAKNKREASTWKKIRNIRQIGELKNKGEEHGRTGR